MSVMSIENYVVCMKWGTKFSSQYVNRLYHMVNRNLTIPYKFICFTDDGFGIDDGIEIHALPEMYLDPTAPERGWRKLSLFAKNVDGLQGRALFLDLDIVIRTNIDSFFQIDGDFLIIKDWDFPNDIIGNSSVFRFSFGKFPYVFENLVENYSDITKRFRNEQAYLSYAIRSKGCLKYWPSDWCVSFKRYCLQPWPLCYFLAPNDPLKAKIVVFHGKPNPEQAVSGWVGKYGFRYIKPTTWLKKYWY